MAKKEQAKWGNVMREVLVGLCIEMGRATTNKHSTNG